MQRGSTTNAGGGVKWWLIVLPLTIAAWAVANSVEGSSLAISGTLSNFDTYNTTPSDSDGAELELEGVHSADILSHYPSHYVSIQNVEYNDSMGNFAGTRIIFDNYNFGGDAAVLAPTANPQSTNGHTCVNLAGCEHFGFSVSQQPTATRFFWRDAAGNRLNVDPLLIPSPTWVYIPPAVPANPPIIRAIVKVPEVEDPVQKADSIWMKVTVTETEQPSDLNDLLSGGPLAGELEVETEWELLEGGLNGNIEVDQDFEPADASQSVVRRYEYFQYTGTYSPEHEPMSLFDPLTMVDPSEVNELGQFIAANMVAVNLVPEPSSVALLLMVFPLLRVRSRHST